MPSPRVRMWPQREGVQPTARHVHPILRTYAAGGALEYLQEKVLLDVATSADIRIDTECFNCLLRVCSALALKCHKWRNMPSGVCHDSMKRLNCVIMTDPTQRQHVHQDLEPHIAMSCRGTSTTGTVDLGTTTWTS